MYIPQPAQLDAPYPVSKAHILRYQTEGYIKLKEVFEPELLTAYGEEIAREVAKRAESLPPLSERSTYGKAFVQIGNLWRENEAIKALTLSKRLGQIAADLMQVSGVRLYHDQALFKEPSGGFTPWHADQYYWPLSSPNCITAWIPLQAVPQEMGPLAFCIGSQKILAHRDLEISDQSEALIETNLKNYPKDVTPYELGEVSFHAGWTFHRAGPNQTDQMRRVMTIIMMEEEMRLIEPQREHQRIDRETWLPGADVGEVIDTPLNPLIYRRED